MTEPTGHCPFLGLKQNRAIRFASATPEHRCYVSGNPLEIPVDQNNYCLSQNHVRCPLYTGSTPDTTRDVAPLPLTPPLVAATGGMRGWMATLAPRDRAIYATMLAMLAAIAAISLILGLQALLGAVSSGLAPTVQSPPPTFSVAATDVVATPIPATAVPTASPSPTLTATANPSAVPTRQPTAQPTASQATSAPTATAIIRPTITPVPFPVPPRAVEPSATSQRSP